MSAKVKLISFISAFILVLGIMIIGVLSAEQVKVNIGGSVSFNATNVYAKVSGNISGAETGNKTFSTLTYSASETTGNESDWTNLELNFDSDASPILIEITVENLSTDRELQVSLENDIQASGLNISITKDSQPYTAGNTAMLAKSTGDGTSTTTFVMSLTVANPDENLTDANFNYILNMTDESAIKEITAQSADSSMGSVTGSGTFVIGEQVTLTATPGQDYLFTEWRANSADGEAVSTSSTYTFTLTSTSPTTYYAVFEQAQAGTLTYTYDDEAKTATVSGCTSGATKVVIPETTIYNGETYTVTGIGTSSSSPFYSTRSTLKSITIPSTITTIGNYAFDSCRALIEINYNATAANDLSLRNRVFTYAGQDGDGITVNIGANVTKLPSCIFYPYANITYSPNITAANFAEGSQCASIGDFAFRYSSLTSITIPEGVTSIGSSAFMDCTALTEINYNATNAADLTSQNYVFSHAGQDGDGITVNIGANVTRVPDYIFCPYGNITDSPNITTVNFAEGSECESIGASAFYYCSGLTSITIPASVTSIGEEAFNRCSSLGAITVEEGNEVYHSAGNCIIETARKTLVTGCKTSVIPTDGSVTSIGDYAFCVCSNLVSITIPEGVTSIGESAFSNCSSLTSITIPKSVTSIGSDAFWGCYALAEVYNYSSKTITAGSFINDGDLGQYAKVVYNASDLTGEKPATRIKDNNGVRYYDDGENTVVALYPLSEDITTVSLDSKTTEIQPFAFSYCSGLTSIIIPESVTRIGESAFSNCSSLTSIIIPSSVTRIDSLAFYNCSSLNEVTVESDNIYLDLTSQSACRYLINYVDAAGEMVRVLKSVVDSVDPNFTVNTYLNDSNFARTISEDGLYYIYTHN